MISELEFKTIKWTTAPEPSYNGNESVVLVTECGSYLRLEAALNYDETCGHFESNNDLTNTESCNAGIITPIELANRERLDAEYKEGNLIEKEQAELARLISKYGVVIK